MPRRTTRRMTHRIASPALALTVAFTLALGLAVPSARAQSPEPIAPEQPEAQPEAQQDAQADTGVSVTVYSSADPAGFDPQKYIAQQRNGYQPQHVWQVPGFGVVKQVQPIEFEEGQQEVRFTDVARFIDPTTVSFSDLTDPGATTVLEQQFRFDLANAGKILERMIGREITVNGITGELISATQGRIILQTDQGVQITGYHDEANLILPELPKGVITKPTLLWLVNSDAAGERNVRTTYQTDGITWRSDYNLVLAPDETTADLGAWVTMMNLSGATYENAKLKLIAGDVQRVEPEQPRRHDMMRARMEMAQAADAYGFEEEAFFEYHLYTLPRRTTIRQNSTQQITLFPTARDADVEKVLVYYGLPEGQRWGFTANPRTDRNLGNQSNNKVDVYIRFQNEEENNLGMPLPAGKVRVFKEDPNDQTLEFVGEDLIDHTPRNEEVLIQVGQAFDIVGERTQTDFTVDSRNHVMTESFRIELRNQKEDEDVKVIVKENLFRWVNWEITEHSDEFEKIDARTIHFPVTVPAGEEKIVEYTVRYTW